MKKFLLLLAVAMLSVSAFAAKSVHLKSKGQWAEYILSNKLPVSADEYVSMKVTVANPTGNFQVKVSCEDIPADDYNSPAYVQFENNVATCNFQEFLSSKGYTGKITVVNLQACDGADQEIDLLEVILVKADGTEEVQELGGDAWGGGAYEAEELEYKGEEPGEEPQPTPGVNHVLKLTQAEAKANPWDTQVFIKVSGLEANKKYVVTLDVMGGSEFTLGSESIDDVQQDHKDQWGNSAVFNYTDEINVTKEWSVGTVNFPGVTTVDCDTHKEKHENTEYAATALLLNVGKTAGDLYIDNVVVKDEEGNVVFTQNFEEATCGADNVTKDVHFFGWQNATWAIVEAEGPTSLGALEAVNADAVAYDLFGNAGATKGFMVKGGKKVYVK